jgi:molecular chaperone GrpE
MSAESPHKGAIHSNGDSTVTQDPNTPDQLQDDLVEIRSSASTSSSSSSASSSVDLSALQQHIDKLQDELSQAKEQVLRTQAEMQNVRRRAQQDVEKAHKFSIEKFVADMLPVADNLERTVAAATSNAEMNTIIEGVELTLKTMFDALKRHQVETVNPEGEPFDPQLHQAMTAIENRDVEPNTVLNVFQRGYVLHGRLVRPAMVVVSKAPL